MDTPPPWADGDLFFNAGEDGSEPQVSYTFGAFNSDDPFNVNGVQMYMVLHEPADHADEEEFHEAEEGPGTGTSPSMQASSGSGTAEARTSPPDPGRIDPWEGAHLPPTPAQLDLRTRAQQTALTTGRPGP